MELLTELLLGKALSRGLFWSPALGQIPYDAFTSDIVGDIYLLFNTCCERNDEKDVFVQFSSRKLRPIMANQGARTGKKENKSL